MTPRDGPVTRKALKIQVVTPLHCIFGLEALSMTRGGSYAPSGEALELMRALERAEPTEDFLLLMLPFCPPPSTHVA
jgi:hypothetical protein